MFGDQLLLLIKVWYEEMKIWEFLEYGNNKLHFLILISSYIRIYAGADQAWEHGEEQEQEEGRPQQDVRHLGRGRRRWWWAWWAWWCWRWSWSCWLIMMKMKMTMMTTMITMTMENLTSTRSQSQILIFSILNSQCHILIFLSQFSMPDFDADGDGVISKEEFENGMRWIEIQIFRHRNISFQTQKILIFKRKQ